MRLTEGGGGFGVQYLTPDLSSALDRQNELERQRQALLAAQRVLDRQQANMAQQDQVFAPAPAPQQGPPVPPGFGAPSPGIDYSAQPVQGPPLPPHFNAPLTGSDFQPSQSPNGILSTNFSSPPRAPFTPAICLLYTSDAADDLLCVDLGGRRIIKKKKKKEKQKRL